MFVNSIWSYYHLSWLWISLILHCYYDADRYETHELCELIRLCFKKKKENFLPFSFFFLSLVFLIKRLQCIGVIVRVTIYQYDSILVRNKISFGMTDFETGIWTTRFMRSHNLFLYLFFFCPPFSRHLFLIHVLSPFDVSRAKCAIITWCYRRTENALKIKEEYDRLGLWSFPKFSL